MTMRAVTFVCGCCCIGLFFILCQVMSPRTQERVDRQTVKEMAIPSASLVALVLRVVGSVPAVFLCVCIVPYAGALALPFVRPSAWRVLRFRSRCRCRRRRRRRCCCCSRNRHARGFSVWFVQTFCAGDVIEAARKAGIDDDDDDDDHAAAAAVRDSASAVCFGRVRSR